MPTDISLNPPFRYIDSVEELKNRLIILVYTYPKQRLFSDCGLPIQDEVFELGIDSIKTVTLNNLRFYIEKYIPDVKVNIQKSTIKQSNNDKNQYFMDIYLDTNFGTIIIDDYEINNN